MSDNPCRPARGAAAGGAFQPLLTVSEVADATGFDERSVRRWIARGELEAIRIGRKLRIRPASFDRFLERNETRVSG